jgi:CxxC-x17-CxxC domain-containing protein
MEFNNQAPRKMFQGDWKCAKCGNPITELPFEPDPARLDKLLCRDCHRERVRSFRRPFGRDER